MKKLLVFLSMLLLIGCTNEQENNIGPDLKIASVVSSLGALENEPGKSILEFEINIENVSDHTLEIESMEPIIIQHVIDIMDEKELKVEMNNKLAAGNRFEIANYIIFKTVRKGELFHSQNDIINGVKVTFKDGQEYFVENKHGK
jgi:uncharacterized protein YcfL